ncbi:MAG: hypothetical protein JKP92_05790 [Alphaproteobacteria bacterium]|jgi:hypothetical protein|nr:hypothetical protein [Alphaproteobacteria bacterium]
MQPGHKREAAIFLAINVAFPLAASLMLRFFPEPYFGDWPVDMPRFVYVSACLIAMLIANMNRIREVPSARWAYVPICVLNVLALPFLGCVSFVTSLPAVFWILYR